MTANADVRVTPLGGVDDIGSRNCHCVDWLDKSSGTRKAILLDCGMDVGNADEEVDAFSLAPNFSAIPADVDEIVAVFLSHGHLDHIGAIHEFIRFYSESIRFSDKLLPWIFATPNTARVIQSKEHVDIHIYETLDSRYAVCGREPDVVYEVESGDIWELDEVKLEFFPMLHSIPGSLGCAVHVNGKKVVYTGDFKLHGINDRETAEYVKVLNSEAIRNADLLLIDSTGSDKEGTGESDEVVVDEIMDTIEAHPKGRIFITSFSSHTDRIYGLMERIKHSTLDNSIVFHGRSMINHMQHVRLVEPLKFGSGFVPGGWKKYSYDGRYDVPDDAIIFLTGSQGEPRSALRRLLEDKEALMADIHIRPEDIVIFAARTIPGNEDAVAAVLSQLRKTRCTIYFPTNHCNQKQCEHEPGAHEPEWARYAAGSNIAFGRYHVSGHAYQDDLKDFVRAASPKKIMPVHNSMEGREKMAKLFPDHEVLLPVEGEIVQI